MFKNVVPISQRTLHIYFELQLLSTASGQNNIHSENHKKNPQINYLKRT